MPDTDMEDKNPETPEPEVIIELIPPVYSRQMKLFGIVIWSDTRQLDEEAFYQRITDRINNDLAKEIIVLRANK